MQVNLSVMNIYQSFCDVWSYFWGTISVRVFVSNFQIYYSTDMDITSQVFYLTYEEYIRNKNPRSTRMPLIDLFREYLACMCSRFKNETN